MLQRNLLNRFNEEIIVDNFAGGGGASTGIELALGRSVDIAINHDPASIAMHGVNHPNTKHYCEDVWDVNPREATEGRPVGLCWLSPDCKHFSKAKGGKPVDKKIRGLAWVAVRWAATVRPRVIILENVEEFKTGGPLLNDGRPDTKQKGRTFQSFVNALKRYGYKVEWKELRACDYGAPTIRKRLFLIARCDGEPIMWPKSTHGAPDSTEVNSRNLRPWRTAAEVIDWSIPCPSIFERQRPLAENTMRRIARGIQKFVIEDPNPFVLVHTSGHAGSKLTDPLRTVTTGNHHYLITSHITKFHNTTTDHSVEEPLHTITAGGDSKRPAGAPHAMGLVIAFLAQYHTETAHSSVRGQSLDEPILTLDTSNRYGLVTGHIVKLKGTNIGHPTSVPLQTVTAGGNHFGEVRVFLMKYYGAAIGQSLHEPLHTVPTFAVVRIHGQDYAITDIGMRMLEPHELFAAQGFPDDYIIDQDATGKKYPKSAQVARCGNSVPPPFAEALTRANLPELCTKPIERREIAN